MSKKTIYSTVVGSYPQPEWLVNRSMLKGNVPFRIFNNKYWKFDKKNLEAAKDKATIESEIIGPRAALTHY